MENKKANHAATNIAIVVLIGVTVSIKIGTVENNRNSFESRVQ